MALKVKAEFKDVVIGFNQSAAPLGYRNDLHILHEMAKRSNRIDYLAMFEEISEDEIVAEKVQKFEAKRKEKEQEKGT